MEHIKKEFRNGFEEFILYPVRTLNRGVVAPSMRGMRRFEKNHRLAIRQMGFGLNVLLLLLMVGWVKIPPLVHRVEAVVSRFDSIRMSNNYSWDTYFKIVMSAAIVPNPAQPLSDLQKETAYIVAGTPAQKRQVFDLVMDCESGGIPETIGANRHGNSVTYDVGPWQINTTVWRSRFENKRYPNAEATAILKALEIGSHVLDLQGPNAWTCYRKIMHTREYGRAATTQQPKQESLASKE